MKRDKILGKKEINKTLFTSYQIHGPRVNKTNLNKQKRATWKRTAIKQSESKVIIQMYECEIIDKNIIG